MNMGTDEMTENSIYSRERNQYLDFLKFLGLSLIILAHVPIPSWLAAIRNFDVPLMVFVSGCLSNASFERSESLFSYYKKRVFRLLVPTWIFLTIYFTLFLIFAKNELPPNAVILKSYLLQNDSIGYVWIIRIYLLCALLVPFVKKLDLSKIYVWVVLIFVYVLYEFACKYRVGMQFRIIECSIYYMVSYGIILLFGLHYEKFSRKNKAILFGLALMCFACLELAYFMKNGEYCFTQKYKYPPRHLFLTHAFAYIFFLMLFETRDFALGKNGFILFVSKSSLWIYLWHILILQVVARLIPTAHWAVKYYVVYSLSVLIVFFQNKALDLIEKKQKVNLPFFRVFRG